MSHRNQGKASAQFYRGDAPGTNVPRLVGLMVLALLVWLFLGAATSVGIMILGLAYESHQLPLFSTLAAIAAGPTAAVIGFAATLWWAIRKSRRNLQ